MNTWFRFYNEALDDPKVQKLPPKLFKYWVNLLCLASRNDGQIPGNPDCAFSLRITEEQCAAVLCELEDRRLIDRNDNGLTPHEWEARQFKSDGSTERVRRFRERERNVSVTLHETGPDTDTDTDTKQKKNSSLIAPSLLRLGEHQRAVMTEADHKALKEKLGVRCDEFIERFDNWVEEAPEAKHNGIRRKDRKAYPSIKNWFMREQKEGKHGRQLDRQERNAETARRLLSRLDSQNGSGGLRGITGSEPARLLGTVTAIDCGTNPNGSKSHN